MKKTAGELADLLGLPPEKNAAAPEHTAPPKPEEAAAPAKEIESILPEPDEPLDSSVPAVMAEENTSTFAVEAEPMDMEAEQPPALEPVLDEPVREQPVNEDRPRRGRRRGRRGRNRGEEVDRDDQAECGENKPLEEENGLTLEEPDEDVAALARAEDEGGELDDEQGDLAGGLQETDDVGGTLEEEPREPSPPEEDDDEEVDKLTDWNVPSWNELISSLYRPDR